MSNNKYSALYRASVAVALASENALEEAEGTAEDDGSGGGGMVRVESSKSIKSISASDKVADVESGGSTSSPDQPQLSRWQAFLNRYGGFLAAVAVCQVGMIVFNIGGCLLVFCQLTKPAACKGHLRCGHAWPASFFDGQVLPAPACRCWPHLPAALCAGGAAPRLARHRCYDAHHAPHPPDHVLQGSRTASQPWATRRGPRCQQDFSGWVLIMEALHACAGTRSAPSASLTADSAAVHALLFSMLLLCTDSCRSLDLALAPWPDPGFAQVSYFPDSPVYSYAGGLILTIVVIFFLGILATRAEPALNVLGR
jgi:hypothetical protein